MHFPPAALTSHQDLVFVTELDPNLVSYLMMPSLMPAELTAHSKAFLLFGFLVLEDSVEDTVDLVESSIHLLKALVNL